MKFRFSLLSFGKTFEGGWWIGIGQVAYRGSEGSLISFGYYIPTPLHNGYEPEYMLDVFWWQLIRVSFKRWTHRARA